VAIEQDSIRSVVRQQLRSDQLFGLSFVPFRVREGSDALPSADDERERAARAERLRVLDETQVRDCRKCHLCQTRTQTVFGQGHPNARIAFVGEAPGYEEDKQGLAFVGRAGQLLTRMIAAMGLKREDVYICNVLKCRPPENRTPAAEEILACSPYLHEQLSIIQPEVIVALGAPAAKTLLNTAKPIGQLRGHFHEYRPEGILGEGSAIPVMPTFHPAYLLRNPEEKRKAWEDLQLVMALLGLPLPSRDAQ
jgi:DNA polymerase